METKKIQLPQVLCERWLNFFLSPFDMPPPLNNNYFFSIAQKGEQGLFFQNDSTHLHPFWRSKDFSRYLMWGCVGWWLKKLDPHPRDHHSPMATKYFWLLGKLGISYVFRSPHWSLSKNIWHTPLLWRPKNFSHHKKGDWKKFSCLKVGKNSSITTKD